MAARHLKTSEPTESFEIIAIDLLESRLELARELGASFVINPAQRQLRDALSELTGGEFVDAALDCTGSTSVINEMITNTGKGGIAVSVGGPPPGATISVDVFDMLVNCRTYRGCHQGNAYSKTVS